jgi:signal transduction histidine kinase
VPRRALLPDTIAPSWLVVQALGTFFIVATLITAREPDPRIWACYGVTTASWIAFMLAGHRFPKTTAALLAVGSAIPAAVVGLAGDSSAIILSVVAFGRFASLAHVGVAVIAGTGLLDAALAFGSAMLAGESLSGALVGPALAVIAGLTGLNRRQYEVQARQAEALLEQTRLAQAEHARAAALDERTRIARELHDVLAHSLGALAVQLELAEALLAEESDVDGALRTLRRSRRLAAEGLAEARDAVAALRRDILPLPEALAAMADAHARDHRAGVDFTTDGEIRPLPSAVVVSLSGIAREALTNAGKHAPGEDVTMRLSYADGVRLSVCNALPGGSAPGEGFGLAGMRERLALAGGTLSAGPVGREWSVVAEVPG